MKTFNTLMLAATAALTLGVGAAVAQENSEGTVQFLPRFTGPAPAFQGVPSGYSNAPARGTFSVHAGHIYLDPGLVGGGDGGGGDSGGSSSC